MKKLCITLGLCLLGLVATKPCHAEMKVQFFDSDGLVQEIDGAVIKNLTITGHTLSVYQNGLPEWTCDTHTLQSIKFKMKNTGVTTLASSPDAGISFRRDGDLIYLDGVSFPQPAFICSMNGSLLAQTFLGEALSFDCSSLSQGIYLIKCAGKNYKFIK